MTMPKAYEPIQGQHYQLLYWDAHSRSYDHLDYAKDRLELSHLKTEYALMSVHPRVITLPRKYWSARL